MKKLQASLLFTVIITGLILAGCQKPVAQEPVVQSVNGTVSIEEEATTSTAEGTVSIVKPVETEATGTMEIKPPAETMPATEVPAPVIE